MSAPETCRSGLGRSRCGVKSPGWGGNVSICQVVTLSGDPTTIPGPGVVSRARGGVAMSQYARWSPAPPTLVMIIFMGTRCRLQHTSAIYSYNYPPLPALCLPSICTNNLQILPLVAPTVIIATAMGTSQTLFLLGVF